MGTASSLEFHMIDDKDVYIDRRLLSRRRIIGLTQGQVGVELGVAFQQVRSTRLGPTGFLPLGSWRSLKLSTYP